MSYPVVKESEHSSGAVVVPDRALLASSLKHTSSRPSQLAIRERLYTKAVVAFHFCTSDALSEVVVIICCRASSHEEQMHPAYGDERIFAPMDKRQAKHCTRIA